MHRSSRNIRLATASDLSAVCELVNVYIRNSTANFRTEPQEPAEWEALWKELHERYPWYVATAPDGELAGLSYARPWNPRGAYAWSAESTVYVAPGHQGQGLGAALYGRLLATLQAQGYRSVVAGVALPNPGSAALHRAAGFEPVGTFRALGHKHGDWHDVSYWQRRFSTAAEPPGELRTVAQVVPVTGGDAGRDAGPGGE
ncbi:GNAT family N-acetyltransferase [Streptomyces sp. ACA25]|uniref:GNAT family N-acetyltransferase n=1 Tax=Streptomyces sp. ACA25 TaxID=3022596 RepID=UPI00230784C7|nr:GNAT family N-acetyltransferase [Streptomyces sp. ACA25]MDB1088355.1 GNAT family N-acetyltransferase [Streptomyces sp. ACA25]